MVSLTSRTICFLLLRAQGMPNATSLSMNETHRDLQSSGSPGDSCVSDAACDSGHCLGGTCCDPDATTWTNCEACGFDAGFCSACLPGFSWVNGAGCVAPCGHESYGCKIDCQQDDGPAPCGKSCCDLFQEASADLHDSSGSSPAGEPGCDLVLETVQRQCEVCSSCQVETVEAEARLLRLPRAGWRSTSGAVAPAALGMAAVLGGAAVALGRRGAAPEPAGAPEVDEEVVPIRAPRAPLAAGAQGPAATHGAGQRLWAAGSLGCLRLRCLHT
ncbi:unnamed protein product [Prorocentrum cordatum]|uniref:Uncharacterized protein n=1 Tax=Prorocentrum cordatum TaxID=2364126 RepID=A0ABN9WRI3_9DINO|nr:unnamed protein product [Polarella glacialis]